MPFWLGSYRMPLTHVFGRAVSELGLSGYDQDVVDVLCKMLQSSNYAHGTVPAEYLVRLDLHRLHHLPA